MTKTTCEIVAGLGTVAAEAALGMAAPAVASAVPVPHYAAMGDHLLLPPTLDGRSYGALFLDLQTSDNPDVVDVNFFLIGTYGAARGCDVRVYTGSLNGISPGMPQYAAVSGGPTTIPLHACRGLSMVSAAATQPFGMGGSYVRLVP